MNRRHLLAGTTLLAAAGLGGAASIKLFGGGGGTQFSHCSAGSVAGGAAQIGGPFELVRGDGQTVTEANVIDRLSLVYFGYTFCPDVCPLDLARNADAVDLLAEDGVELRPVFITVDPARDTPEVVGDFASYMHESMVGLTGSEDQVTAAKSVYKAFGDRPPGQDDEAYLVNHSTFSYLMHPDHGMLEFFRNDVSSEEMASRVACFASAV